LKAAAGQGIPLPEDVFGRLDIERGGREQRDSIDVVPVQVGEHNVPHLVGADIEAREKLRRIRVFGKPALLGPGGRDARVHDDGLAWTFEAPEEIAAAFGRLSVLQPHEECARAGQRAGIVHGVNPVQFHGTLRAPDRSQGSWRRTGRLPSAASTVKADLASPADAYSGAPAELLGMPLPVVEFARSGATAIRVHP